jgi:hypothetical protein
VTLNALEFWRKAVPFAIAVLGAVPWMAARAQSPGECALIVTVALAAGFLYVILGVRGPNWRREMDKYVNTQIRNNLVRCCVVAAFCTFVLISRGWLGPGPGVKLPPEVKSAYVTDGSHKRYAAVVFVHGIFGAKDDTWLSADHSASFP